MLYTPKHNNNNQILVSNFLETAMNPQQRALAVILSYPKSYSLCLPSPFSILSTWIDFIFLIIHMTKSSQARPHHRFINRDHPIFMGLSFFIFSLIHLNILVSNNFESYFSFYFHLFILTFIISITLILLKILLLHTPIISTTGHS